MKRLAGVMWGLATVFGVVVVGCGKSTSNQVAGEIAGSGVGQGDHGGEAAAGAGEGGESGSVPSICTQGTAKLLSFSTFGAHADRFSGPAVVERSTSGDLLLAFDLSGTEAGGTVVAGARLKLTGLSAMPRIAPGKRVWLEQDAPPPNYSDSGPSTASSFSVWGEQGGTLLLGRSYTNSVNTDTAAAPLEVVAIHARCTEHNDSCDSREAKREWQAVEVVGDTNVTLEPGASTQVELRGVVYDAVALAFDETTGDGFCAADYRPLGNVNVSVVAADLDALTSKVPVVDLPACSVHNDLESSAGFSLIGVGLGTDYAGPAVYQSTAEREGLTEHEFSTPDLKPQFPDSPPSLELTDWSKDFVPPARGTTLYFESHGYGAGALFSQKGGAPVFVTAIMLEPFDRDMVSTLSAWLGVPVELQKTCDYTNGAGNGAEPPLSLWQLALGTEPPVTVHTGERAKVVIAGQKYEAYLGGLEATSFVLRAL